METRGSIRLKDVSEFFFYWIRIVYVQVKWHYLAFHWGSDIAVFFAENSGAVYPRKHKGQLQWARIMTQLYTNDASRKNIIWNCI